MTRPGAKALGALTAVAVGVAGVRLWAATAAPPATLGLFAGRLSPCPETPNCVSTEPPDARMEPWPFTGSPASVRAALIAIVANRPRARLMTVRPDYIHAEFRSAVFGFVDDVEFHIDADSGLVHFRSASRLGGGDFDVNRRRMEALGTVFRNGRASLRD